MNPQNSYKAPRKTKTKSHEPPPSTTQNTAKSWNLKKDRKIGAPLESLGGAAALGALFRLRGPRLGHESLHENLGY